MSDKTWQLSAVVLGAAAIGMGAYAVVEYNVAQSLATQLAASVQDAKSAHDTATKLTEQLAAEASDAQKAHEDAQSTQAKLVAETRPDLPVNLTFRRALLSAGLVGVFRNTSSQELEFVLDLESPATGRHVSRSVVLNPNGLVEVGAQQGWAFAPGQRVGLNNPQFRPIVKVIGS